MCGDEASGVVARRCDLSVRIAAMSGEIRGGAPHWLAPLPPLRAFQPVWYRDFTYGIAVEVLPTTVEKIRLTVWDSEIKINQNQRYSPL